MRRLCAFAMVTVLCLAVSANETTSETSAGSVVVIEKPVHFVASGGEAIVVPAGTYKVNYAGNTQLELVPEQGEPVTIQATATSHEEPVEQMRAFSIPNEPDEHHVILWMPGGLGLDAAGSYSGIRSRGVGPLALKQQYVEQYAQANAQGALRNSLLNDQASGSRPPPPPPGALPDLVLTASMLPRSPMVNQPVSIRVYIINQGQADATLVQQPNFQAHVNLQAYDSAGRPWAATGISVEPLPLTIPAGGSRYVDYDGTNQKWMTRAAGTFYWQFTIYSHIAESNTANNVGPREPFIVR